MEVTIAPVPLWVSILFLIVIPIPAFLIARMIKRAVSVSSSPKKASAIFNGLLLSFSLYSIYACIASWLGWYDAIMLPPKIMVLTAIPLLIVYIGILLPQKRVRQIFAKIELERLVSIQLFRLVGSFFLILLFLDTLPKPLGIIAGTGDVFVAVTSIFVARQIKQKKQYAKPITWIWNTIGLLDILITSAMAAYYTQLTLTSGVNEVTILGSFPFCLIPAFAPATIIFLHILIYRKLISERT